MNGKDLRDEGTDRVQRGDPEWHEAAFMALTSFCRRWETFSSDDFRMWIAGYYDEQPRHHNSWGALFNAAVKDGLIKPVGFKLSKRPSAHARAIRIWESLTYEP